MDAHNPTEIIQSILFYHSSPRAQPGFQFCSPQQVLTLMKNVRDVFKMEPAVLQVEGEFVIVGDLHGSISSLLRIFDRLGYPPQRSYIFLGDYVDRGVFSCDVLFMLFSLKVLFPSHVYMIRGNHECESLTAYYGFKKECRKRFNTVVYYDAVDTFEFLPIACVVNDRTLCVHGGISPSVNDIFQLQKPKTDPIDGDVADILWSDPNCRIDGFMSSKRGKGYNFGEAALRKFLKLTGFDRLIRSHESCFDGFHQPFADQDLCTTVFSACDYCNSHNSAAVILMDKKHNMKLEFFAPLTMANIAKRRVLIPEFILLDNYNQKVIKAVETVDACEDNLLPSIMEDLIPIYA